MIRDNLILKNILQLWKKSFVPILFLFIATSISFTYPIFTKWAIDSIILEKNHSELLPLAITLFLLTIVERVFIYFNNITFFEFQKKNIISIQKDLIHKVFHYPMEFFDKNHSGYLVGRIRGDITGLNYIFSEGLIMIFMDVIKFLGAFIILSQMNLKLTLICIGTIPLLAIKITSSSKSIKDINSKILKGNAELEKELSDTLQGMELLKSFARETEGINRANQQLEWFNDIEIERNKINAKYRNVIHFIVTLGNIALLYFGIQEVINSNLSIGGYMAFAGYLIYLYSPAKNLSDSFIFIDYAKRSYERIKDLMKFIPETHSGFSIKTIKEIRVNNISFSYKEKDMFIKDLSFTIKKGEKVLLQGPSGCGKTTVIKLLLGLYRPKEGIIYYNNSAISEINIKDLRDNKVGYISQSVFLFNKTVRENLLLGNKEIEEQELWKILCLCKLDKKVKSLPKSLDELIEEKGVNFSGGEKQRLAIARALIKNPEILIIDEGTSNLDIATEISIIDLIENLFDDKIIIRVTHRDIFSKEWKCIYLGKQDNDSATPNLAAKQTAFIG